MAAGLADADRPQRPWAVWSPDLAGPLPDLGPAWRKLFISMGWTAGSGTWGPLVLAGLSGGARVISGLSEFFHEWSRRRSIFSDLRSRGVLMVGGDVGGDGSLSGSGSRGLP
jgi:hypothetical protein